VIALYVPVLRKLFARWLWLHGTYYSDGFLVVILSAYLVGTRSARLLLLGTGLAGLSVPSYGRRRAADRLSRVESDGQDDFPAVFIF
jgi:hypothetical protein